MKFINLESLEYYKVHQWGRDFNADQRIKAFERSLPNAQQILDGVKDEK
jgi:hypothetical protein